MLNLFQVEIPVEVYIRNELGNTIPKHMAGSSQPQHFFAAGCVFADIAIPVIFYPVKKLYEYFCASYLGVEALIVCKYVRNYLKIW